MGSGGADWRGRLGPGSCWVRADVLLPGSWSNQWWILTALVWLGCAVQGRASGDAAIAASTRRRPGDQQQTQTRPTHPQILSQTSVQIGPTRSQTAQVPGNGPKPDPPGPNTLNRDPPDRPDPPGLILDPPSRKPGPPGLKPDPTQSKTKSQSGPTQKLPPPRLTPGPPTLGNFPNPPMGRGDWAPTLRG